MSLHHALLAVLNRAENYTETLRLRPLPALPGWAELTITGRLDTARDPHAEQVRYHAMLPTERAKDIARRIHRAGRPRRCPMTTPMRTVPVQSVAYRPATYWPAKADLQHEILTKIKGTKRRRLAMQLLDSGDLRDADPELTVHALSEEDRQSFGRIHPSCMGGEYLSDLEPSEVEIARIPIQSTTGDVTSVYARREGRRIHYRVVDEYGGDTLRRPTERWSILPLRMGELVRFFLGAWDLCACLDNFENDDPEYAMDFFSGDSEFYPYFDDALRRVVRRHWRATGRHGVAHVE